MKKLAVAAMGMGDISLMMGLYVAFVLAPQVEAARIASIEDPSAPAGDFGRALSTMVSVGEIGLVIGGVGLILGLIAGFKTKWVLAWVAAGTAAIGLLLNAAYATHMFS